MRLTYKCPVCDQIQSCSLTETDRKLACETCDWSRAVTVREDSPEECLVCGCPDLWRQKDFPQRLGLLMVAIGAIASTIAYLYYYPITALAILMVFALADMLLFAFMRDVLVCYRCNSRHRPDTIGEEHPYFDLEVAERYRQQQKRMEAVESRE